MRGADQFGIVQKELTTWERLYNQAWLRKAWLLVLLAVAWEAYGRHLDNQLLVPTFADTVTALWGGIVSGVLPERAWASIQVLAIGFTTGVVLAGVLTVLAITTRIGTDFLETVTAMFSPLPAIALLPLAMIWFGLGYRQPGVRAGALGAVAAGAEHACRVPRGVADIAHGRDATMACRVSAW